jgi:hypothetical protein
MAAFAATVLFLILTVLVVTVTLQSPYAWLVMGAIVFLFIIMCSYTSCEKTYWQRRDMHSESVSTISDGHDVSTGGQDNRAILPYWITDLPPSYAAATSQQHENATGRISPNIPPPPYAMTVEIPTTGQISPAAPSEDNHSTGAQHQHLNGKIHIPDTLTLHQPHPYRVSVNSSQNCGPPERTHSLRIPKNEVTLSSHDCKRDTLSLDRYLAKRRIKKTTDESSSVC